VEATAANARANDVEVAVERLDLRAQRPPWAPVVTANLVRPLLLALAGGMERPPELLIASGLLMEEADEVAAAFAAAGLRERERRTAGEWAALLLASG
jgi:ribosomal protein L11 methyltransferase